MSPDAPGGTITTRTWPSVGTNFTFPEQEPGVLPPTPNTGVCFSGGGSRSHAATVGQLRALSALGMLNRVRYLSSVSGSSWACAPFTYYGGPADDATLLGAVVSPEQLSVEALGQVDDRCLLSTATRDFQGTLVHLAERLAAPPDQLWIQTVGETFLAPFGLFDATCPASFSLNDTTVDAIKSANPHLAEAPFHTIRSDAPRPYLVMTSCIVWPDNLLEAEHLVSCEYTPLCVGSPLLQTLQTTTLGITRTRIVGGGFIEPFAFGSEAPSDSPDAFGSVQVNPPAKTFTLADACGASSSAYSALLDKLDCTLLSPHVPCWPIAAANAASAERLVFADGGSLENLGLLTLLRRKVERLIVFVNTFVPLNLDYDPSVEPGPQDVDPAFAQVFGRASSNPSRNCVFGRQDYERVVRALQTAKRSGGTVMASADLDVQSNQWWGIDGGWSVRVCWIYNDRVAAWESRLPSDVRQLIDEGQPPSSKGPVQGFPHYKTEFENGRELVQLTVEQATLLGHLSCWNVIENRVTFEDVLSTT